MARTEYSDTEVMVARAIFVIGGIALAVVGWWWGQSGTEAGQIGETVLGVVGIVSIGFGAVAPRRMCCYVAGSILESFF